MCLSPLVILPLIITLICAVYSFSAISGEEIYSLSALADYLNLESCDLYMKDLSGSQLSEFSSDIPAKSFHVLVNNRRSLSSLKFAKGSACQVLVRNAKEIVPGEKLAKSFRRQYVIDLVGGYLRLDNDSLTFDVPTFIFTSNSNATGTIDVRALCPHEQKLRLVNVWRPETGFLITPPPPPTQACPNDLQNKLVEVSAFGLPPYILTSKKKEISGIDADVLDIIAKKMGLRYRVTFGGTWGSMVNETTWTGVMGKVLSGEALIGMGHIIMNDDRKKVLDFTAPLYNEDLYFLSTKPKATSPYMNIVHPFTLSAWLAFLASLVTATFAVYFFTGMHHDSEYVEENIMACYRVQFLQSGVELRTSKQTPHVVFGFYCVFAVFFNLFYLCNFRSYLMQIQYEKPINTPEDMVEQGRDVYLAPGGIFQDLFSHSPNAAVRELFRSTTEKKLGYNYVNGLIPKSKVDEILDVGGALLFAKYPGTISLRSFDQMYGHVPMRIGTEVIFPFYSGFVLSKKSPWKEEMDMVILRLIQGGVISRLEKNSISPRYQKEEEPDTSPRAFRVAHIMGALFVITIGSVLGVVAFLGELALGFRRRNDVRSYNKK